MYNEKHIVINALSAKRGGGKTYIENFISNINVHQNLKISLLIYRDHDLNIDNPSISVICFRKIFKNPFILYLWESLFLKKFLINLGAEIYFVPGGLVTNSLKNLNIKTVTMFRNMIPFDKKQRKKWPFGYMKLRNQLLNSALSKSMVIADLVIFISKYGQKVILEDEKLKIKKHTIINHGVSNKFRTKSEDCSRKLKKLFQKEYILYPSIIDVYKSQKELVHAYSLLHKRGIKLPNLYLVGQEYGSYAKEVRLLINNKNLDNKIFIIGEINYKYIPYIYQNSKFIIYASESENCPNILLESMAASKAIICSSNEPMPEFGKDSVLYFNPNDIDDLANKILLLLGDSLLTKKLETSAFNSSKFYDWKLTVQKTVDQIMKL